MKQVTEPLNLPDSILGVSLTGAQKELLRQGKETGLITGFTTKNGEKFDAYLSIDGENKFVFRPVEGRESPLNENQTTNQEVDREIDRLLNRIDFIVLASLIGFEPLSPQEDEASFMVDSTQDLVVLKNKTGIFIAVVKDANGTRFIELGNAAVGGDARDFFTQYHSPFAVDLLATLKRSSLRSYTGGLGTVSYGSSLRKADPGDISAWKSSYEEIYKWTFSLTSLSTREWFYRFELKDATLDHTFFRNRFYSKSFQQTKGKDTLLPVFPLFNRYGISGFCYPRESAPAENTGYEDFDLFGFFGKGVWLSNVINEQKIRRLVIVSNPVEALSYHQMYAKPSDLLSVYLACCGPDANFNSLRTQEIIDLYKPDQVVIATRQDETGNLLSTDLHGSLSEPRQPVKNKNTFREESSEIKFDIRTLPERNNEFALLRVSLNFSDFEKGIFMNDNLVKYFDQINVHEMKEHSDFGEISPFSVNIKHISKHTSLAEVVFPLGKGLMPTAERIVRHLRPLIFLKSEKPGKQQGAVSFSEDLRLQSKERLSAKEDRSKLSG